MTPAMKFIRYALSIGALEFPPNGFKKNNRDSPYFFNSGAFCTGKSIRVLARAYAAAITGWLYPDVVFATEQKCIPIATALAQVSGGDINISFLNKDETIAGTALEGKEVLGVSDAMMTGNSLREAREIIRATGGKLIGCIIAFDRQEIGGNGSQSAIEEFRNDFGIEVFTVATLDDLIKVLKEGPELEKILAYREKFGAV